MFPPLNNVLNFPLLPFLLIYPAIFICNTYLSHSLTLFTLIFFAVLWQNQAVWHACQAPAWSDLFALCAAVEGPQLHSGATHLSGAALGHQGLCSSCCVSHDGNDLKPQRLSHISLFAFTLYAKDTDSASPIQVICHTTEECISAVIGLKEIPNITVLHNYVHLHQMKILNVLSLLYLNYIFWH